MNVRLQIFVELLEDRIADQAMNLAEVRRGCLAFAKSEVLTTDTLQCQDRWCDVQGRLTLLFKWFL